MKTASCFFASILCSASLAQAQQQTNLTEIDEILKLTFERAQRSGDEEMMDKLLEANISPEGAPFRTKEEKVKYVRRELVRALDEAPLNKTDLVKLYIQHGALEEVSDEDAKQMLELSLRDHHKSATAHLLINAEGFPKEVFTQDVANASLNRYLRSPMISRSGADTYIEFLGASPSDYDPVRKSYPLMQVMKRGMGAVGEYRRNEVVEMMILKGASPLATTPMGENTFHRAYRARMGLQGLALMIPTLLTNMSEEEVVESFSATDIVGVSPASAIFAFNEVPDYRRDRHDDFYSEVVRKLESLEIPIGKNELEEKHPSAKEQEAADFFAEKNQPFAVNSLRFIADCRPHMNDIFVVNLAENTYTKLDFSSSSWRQIEQDTQDCRSIYRHLTDMARYAYEPLDSETIAELAGSPQATVDSPRIRIPLEEDLSKIQVWVANAVEEESTHQSEHR